jgi:hypothetical protein
VLALERNPVGVGNTLVGLAPVKGDGGQVVFEGQRRVPSDSARAARVTCSLKRSASIRSQSLVTSVTAWPSTRMW